MLPLCAQHLSAPPSVATFGLILGASVATLPDTVKLLPSFDADRLRADLEAVEERFRTQTNPVGDYSNDGDAGGWDVLLLRCPGGDPVNTGMGNGGMEDFADTPYLDSTPYVREVLDGLGVPVRGVRFSSLAAGSTVGEHTDRPYGLPVGWVRLHIPVTTNERAVLVVNHADNRWQPGEFWYANFGLPHSLYNEGSEARVHLIIDCYVSPGFFDLVPEAAKQALDTSEIMYFQPEQPLPDEFSALRGTVQVPSSFYQAHTEPPTEAEWDAADDVDGELAVQDGRLVMSVGGQRAALAYIGDGEFRPLCWSQERTLVLNSQGEDKLITFRYRHGAHRVETDRKQPQLVG